MRLRRVGHQKASAVGKRIFGDVEDAENFHDGFK
jgi:hypothetical protein